DPAHYGGVRHDANYGISTERDGFEMQLARAALARPDLPVLCICRGMQLLNVALGGDLVAHIPDRYGDRVPHRRPERLPVEHAGRRWPSSGGRARRRGARGLTLTAARSATQDFLGRETDARMWRRYHAPPSCRGWRSQRGKLTRPSPVLACGLRVVDVSGSFAAPASPAAAWRARAQAAHLPALPP